MGILDDFVSNATAPIRDPEMECIENPKKFLFFRWYGRHAWENVGRVCPWGALDWHKYEVETTCSRCGLTKKWWGKSEGLLIRNGISIETLAECRRVDDWVEVKHKS